MNPSEIKIQLQALGGRANKKLGQHFLIDERVLRSIIEAADIQPHEQVLEIGPGLGVLTRELVDRGANVIAIEQDRRFVEYFYSIFNSSQPPLKLRGGAEGGRVKVEHGDAAKLDWTTLMSQLPWKFISNLPYSITSLALRKALWNDHPPQKIVVLIQREVAERAIAKDGKSSLLSLMVALGSSSARIVRRVSAGAFYPPPRVESAVLEITPLSLVERKKKWGVDPEKIMLLAKKGFAHPRKFLASNLGLTQGQFTIFSSIIPPKARAEELSPELWAGLARLL